MPMRATRVTVKGLSALNAYLDGKDYLVTEMRKWNPSNKDVAALCVVPNEKEWVRYADFIKRLREAGESWTAEQYSDTVTKLERDGLIAVFREVNDATYLRCDIGQWTFWTQWTVVRKQTTARLDGVANSLYDYGFATIPGNPAMKVSLA